MINPYAILGALVAAVGLALSGYFYGHHVETLAFDAYKSQQAASAEKQIVQNHDAVAAVAASEAEGLRQIAATQKENIDELTKRRDALVAANSDLAVRLQHYLASAGRPATSVPQVAAGTRGSDAAGDAALSVGLQQFTGWAADELYAADVLAVRLTAAQKVIEQDRLVCNGELPGIVVEK